ncbi:MAG: DUF3536 domain-containing protein [Deltaproteobacteria bacterium]|nr:DUF3536 domain-containing protein [Deltaproteobacteria bacterium]
MAASPEEQNPVYLVLHGHFYQPPRENPWIEAVEREPSAEPFHNWNERITTECYAANARARVFNDQGRVANVVNNYELLSFNFGPTLLSWLEQVRPEVYAQILEADRSSARRRSGHGNAIGQAYNHAILPLCNARDLRTQLRWGAYDFRHRFGRAPEALWLPETAIDQATVEALIDEGMSFVVLSPRQAKRVRPLAEEAQWVDVSGGRVDPRLPYRITSRRNPHRSLAAFFYDGPVAHALSFEQAVNTSRQLLDRFQGAVDPARELPQLVHAAVDGETFGHHQRHAERAVTYALGTEAEQRGFRLTNYGEFLDAFPPTHEVELELGPEGEGSSWSCAHGVGRWCRDCGCHAGAPAGWNQAWRTPLRQAVNLVRDRAADLFEEMGGELFRDVWAARDAYVHLLLDRSAAARERYLDEHARRAGSTGQQVRMLQLLELQRHSLLSQTSCGWFFDDISGLEALQVLRYLARTVELVEQLSGQVVEPTVLAVLGEAKSNLPELGTGADLYRQRVLPSRMDSRRVVAHYAVTDLHQTHAGELVYYGHQLHRVWHRRLDNGPFTVELGRLQVEHLRTGELDDLAYALIHFGGHDFHCAVRPSDGGHGLVEFAEGLAATFSGATVTDLLRAVDAQFGQAYYQLHQLLREERERVLGALFRHLTEEFGRMYVQLYESNRRTLNALLDAGLKMPEEFRIAAEYTLTRQVDQEIAAQQGSRDASRYRRARQIVAEAAKRGYRLSTRHAAQLFDQLVKESLTRFTVEGTVARCREFLDLLALARELELGISLAEPQDLFFAWLARPDEAWRPLPEGLPPALLEEVAGELGFAVELVRERLGERAG